MNVAGFLARFWGSLFMILGTASVVSGFLERVIGYTKNKAITVSTGYITFLLGLITVTLHNHWTTDRNLAITLLGWITLFKGIEKVVFPNRISKIAAKFKPAQKVWGFVIFVIGVFYYWIGLN